MREQEMRERAQRVLGRFRRGALVSALGIGLPLGGCATGTAAAAHDRLPVQADKDDQPVGEMGTSTAIYAAVLPADEGAPAAEESK